MGDIRPATSLCEMFPWNDKALLLFFPYGRSGPLGRDQSAGIHRVETFPPDAGRGQPGIAGYFVSRHLKSLCALDKMKAAIPDPGPLKGYFTGIPGLSPRSLNKK
jgi:hypothetical protein